MLAEVQKPKMRGKHVRIHDAGDFYDLDYLRLWIAIAEQTPDVTFYAYTKEVAMFQRYQQTRDFPNNFRYLFSLGGKQDHLIDLDNERHAEVFTDLEAIEAAGYSNQDASDLLAITLPTNKIGIPANNIKHFNRKMAGRTFGEIQRERDNKLDSKRRNA
jgi:hypothetical protein